ncbi:MAG: exodeoxyribonuclease V subunit beta [Proteobacteria bacterium]|nr:exodeoxyribonuclease V subunit beta [Pseudomonadota bacterium]MBU1688785.1 exodeoxyribonuclease V subunit beta [Pseudomonadota bacterium]
MIERFDLLEAPLTGTHLIDASAGTGKTYTIAGLIVRLLVEREVPINEILVVTFTEAATEDLRTRIRGRIMDAGRAFCEGECFDDPFLLALVERVPDHQRAGRLLTAAMRGFDEAMIFTIHGFCRKMLRENSLESGVLFDSELITDQHELFREISEDFFRHHFYGASRLFVRSCGKDFLPDRIRRTLAPMHQRADLTIRPVIDRAQAFRDFAGAERGFRIAHGEVVATWAGARLEVATIFSENPGLNRSRYSLKSIPAWLAAMDRLVVDQDPPSDLFPAFSKFTRSSIEAAVKKGFSYPVHPLFDLCELLAEASEVLVAAVGACRLALQAEYYRFVHDELTIRKGGAHQQSFDDLLTTLAQGLKGPGGDRLCRVVRDRFQAAMIDEFQDTDGVQYGIFSRLFQGSDILLYLIGDPKQAIYSFRGADIFAYIQAVRDVGSRYTLDRNFRSVPGLIQAVNALFSKAPRPFVFDEIEFDPVRPGSLDHSPLLINRSEEPPLHLVLLNRNGGPEGETALMPKEAARIKILDWLAGEITSLLWQGRQGMAMIGADPLIAGDIVVLVRTNAEARRVQARLEEVAVASVLHSSESLFASREAEEMAWILKAIGEPRRGGLLRLALATRILGVAGEKLDQFNDDNDFFDLWYERLLEYHDHWIGAGFFPMFTRFIDSEGVRERLLGRIGGTRSLTNVLHLQEVLHLAAVEHEFGMVETIRFLEERIAGAGLDLAQEEYQLRLESDAELVQIVTIHKAKGLQYPIVFCPFSWNGSRLVDRKGSQSGQPLIYHGQDDGNELILDLTSPPEPDQLAAARLEEMAEDLRVLYVALTRAVQRCYLVWGAIKGAGTSALAYLLHRDEGDDPGFDFLSTKADHEIRADLAAVTAAAGSGMVVYDLEVRSSGKDRSAQPSQKNGLMSRAFMVPVGVDWRVFSFSSLAGGHIRSDHGPEWFGATMTPKVFSATDRDIFSFPAGAAAGTFLHTLLEKLDFQQYRFGEARLSLRNALQTQGYDPDWDVVLDRMLDGLLNHPLDPSRPDHVLSNIGSSERLNELEFYFPLKGGGAHDLDQFLARFVPGWRKVWPVGIFSKSFEVLRGFMKGYIDLVFQQNGKFFIVDWKSNLLGHQPEDYGEELLIEVMARERYSLQYLIYTIALHRYLGQRIADYRYEHHFGGIYYIFLRGVGHEGHDRAGIFRARPDLKVVQGLDALLEGAGVVDRSGPF